MPSGWNSRLSLMTLRLTVSIRGEVMSRSLTRSSVSSPQRSPLSMAVSAKSRASASGNVAQLASNCRIGFRSIRWCLFLAWPRPIRRPALLFGLAGNAALSQVAPVLFVTSLFAAALAFHKAVWRYAFALGRENVLPAALERTGGNNIPKAASLAQSVTAFVVIAACALTHQNPMARLFFWGGTTGGLGVIILLAATSAAVIAFFARGPRGENTWRRLAAPALAAVAVTASSVVMGGLADRAVFAPVGLVGSIDQPLDQVFVVGPIGHG
jgi:amino acid transporter